MSASLFRSLASSWLGLLLAIIVGMLLAPFVVATLGPEDYGLWAFILALTNQFTLLELGAREAVVSFVARSRHHRNTNEISETASTGAFFFGSAAILALLAMVLLVPHLGQLTDIPIARMPVITIVFLLCALDAALEIWFGVFDSTLAGSERYDVLTGLNVVRIILNALTLYFVLHAGLGIVGLAATAVTLRLAQRSAACYFSFHFNPGMHISRARISRASIRRFVGFSARAAVINISNRLIHRIDTVIAGFFLGPVAVTTYAIPLILIEQFRLFAESGNGILTPRFSALHAGEDRSTSKLLLLRWSRYSYFLASGIGIPLLLTGPDFIQLWMHRNFTESGTLLQLLTLPYFLTVPSMVFTYYLYATNRHGLNARILSAEACANVVLSVTLAQSMGLKGIALGTLVPAVMCRGVLLPIFACKCSPLSLSEFVRTALLSCLPLTAVQAGSLYLLQSYIGSSHWTGFLVCNAAVLLFYCAGIWVFYLGDQEKSYLRRRLVGKKRGT